MNEVLIEVNSLNKGIVKRSLDYIIACSLIELDIFNYNIEVIKALAVLLRSKLFKRIKNSSYYISGEDTMEIDENAYEALKAEHREIILRAMKETSGVIVESGGKAVDLYYTVCCGGGTANSEDVMGYRLNYLRKVLCRYCGDDFSESIVGVNEIREKVLGKGPLYKDEVDNVFKNVKRDETGRIIEIEVLGRVMSGKEFMRLLELEGNRVFFTEEAIRLKIKGIGGGLGICLKGADSLANQGMSYKDIISYYYTGVKIERINEGNVENYLTGRMIAIDPGHGGDDRGNIHLNIVEKNVNYAIALYLKGLLEGIGAEVIMTRNGDEDIALGERIKLINSKRPDFFISVHQNSFASPGVNGVEAYCYAGDREAIKLSDVILKEISSTLGIKYRGVKTGDYYLLREARISGLILETMYITGNQDTTKYNEENYSLIAKAICKAICSFYGVEFN
jgi:stage II sporulation protein D